MLALFLGLVVTASACAHSSGGRGIVAEVAVAPLAQTAIALRRGGGARITGSMSDARQRTVATFSGGWTGALTGAGDVQIAVAGLGAGAPAALIWRDRTLFVRRAPGAVATSALQPLLRAPAEKPWRQFELVGSGAGDVVMAAFDPPALVGLLQHLAVPTSKVGATAVDGHAATEWVTLRPVALGLWTDATVDLWLGSDNRVLRVRVSAPFGGMQYDVHDFGYQPRVAAPPASEIASGFVAPARAVGAFVPVRSGVTNGIQWSLERAPGDSGTTCWQWRSVPALVRAGSATAACVPAPDPSVALENQIEFVVNGNDTGRYDALAMTLPDTARRVLLGFVGGKTVLVPAANPFVWTGPIAPTIAFERIVFSDGSSVDCGAGAIATLADLGDDALTAGAGAAPWACLPTP